MDISFWRKRGFFQIRWFAGREFDEIELREYFRSAT